MRRRSFLGSSAALAALVTARPTFAANGAKAGAAVVIGIRKTGNLPELDSPQEGAREMGIWLRSEGFDVATLIDDQGPVRIHQVVDAVTKFVKRGTIEQLVVYFSGHGFLNNRTEFWMLSLAPENTNEAINLTECAYAARLSGIPNVVFVSDACRSIPRTFALQSVNGGNIFPAGNENANPGEIDLFFAAAPGAAALELELSDSVKSYFSLYTKCFRDAFNNPEPAMVRTVDGVQVVTNRNLKPYLRREVDKAAQARSIKLRQVPEARVESGEETYIARVATVAAPKPAAKPAPPAPPPDSSPPVSPSIASVPPPVSSAPVPPSIASSPPPVSSAPASSPPWVTEEADRNVLPDAIRRFYKTQMSSTGGKPIPGVYSLRLGSPDPVWKEAATTERLILTAPRTDALKAGFVVAGAGVAGVAASPGIQTRITTDAKQASTSIDVMFGTQAAATVAVSFDGGTGTVLAAFPYYVGTVVVDRGKVVNVTYTRSDEAIAVRATRLDQLRASVAAAVQHGAFRIEGSKEDRAKEARRLGDALRVGKSVDPTLGLYAAYAYDEAGFVEDVGSVRSSMRATLNADIFDFAMLSGEFSRQKGDPGRSCFPFCPMLSQGWNLLRVKGVTLSPLLVELRQHLQQSLWTTFGAAGVDIALRAASDGRRS